MARLASAIATRAPATFRDRQIVICARRARDAAFVLGKLRFVRAGSLPAWCRNLPRASPPNMTAAGRPRQKALIRPFAMREAERRDAV